MWSIRIVRKVEVLLSKEREWGKTKESVRMELGTWESLNHDLGCWRLSYAMVWDELRAECGTLSITSLLRLWEREAELTGDGRGTASPRCWLIWTKSTSVHTKEQRRTSPYNPQPWQLPGAISPSKAHFHKLRGAQGQMAGGNQIKDLEEGAPDAGCHVWLLPHCLQNRRSPLVVQLYRAAFPCTVITTFRKTRSPSHCPHLFAAISCIPIPACCTPQAPQPLLALACLSQCLPTSAHGPGPLSSYAVPP